MPDQKTRIGPVLTQPDGLKLREIYLRIDPRIDLYIKEKWEEGAGTKLPTVLLHGAGMDGAGWDVPVDGASLLDALARNGSRAFAFDFRGHGRSSRVVDGKTVTVETSVADTPERITGRVLVVTGDLDPFASIADTEAFLQATRASHTRHLRQTGIGHLPYVERDAPEVQSAINELVDACTADVERL